jgi:hypothetical protein
MPGTFLWIMNGTTLIPAPSMEQIPVAASPARPRCLLSPVEVGDVEKSGMDDEQEDFCDGAARR